MPSAWFCRWDDGPRRDARRGRVISPKASKRRDRSRCDERRDPIAPQDRSRPWDDPSGLCLRGGLVPRFRRVGKVGTEAGKASIGSSGSCRMPRTGAKTASVNETDPEAGEVPGPRGRFDEQTASRSIRPGKGADEGPLPADRPRSTYWAMSLWLTGSCLNGVSMYSPAGVMTFAQTVPSMVSEMILVEPSHMTAMITPGCRLLGKG